MTHSKYVAPGRASINTHKSHRTQCTRCGDCCRGSSPTLQMEDVPILTDGFIEKSDLYTVRVGELVYDNIHDRAETAQEEFVKVREGQDGRGCLFYDEAHRACEIYEHRPSQCAALACWDTNEFMKVYKGPNARRGEIIHDTTLLGLIREHERKCSYEKLDKCVKQIETEGEGAVDRVLELLKFDYHIRPFVSQKLDMDPREMDFIFGRPLTETIPMFGLKVTREPDGSFFLTTLKTP